MQSLVQRRGSLAGPLFAVVLAPGLFVVLPYLSGWSKPLLGGVLLLSVSGALRYELTAAAHLALLGGLLILALCLFPPTSWPVPLLAALAVYAVAVERLPRLGRLHTWLRAGSITPQIGVVIAGIAIISGIALVLWSAVASPDWAQYRQHFPALPVWLLIPGAFAFSVVNAAAEEIAFRGILQGSLEEVVSQRAALILQAVSFGLLHIHGFPSGASGMVLSGVYGLMLGGVRIYSGGLLAPWIAHVAADAVIVVILLVTLVL